VDGIKERPSFILCLVFERSLLPQKLYIPAMPSLNYLATALIRYMARTFTLPTCRRISATSYLVPFCQAVEEPTSSFKLENCW
jgi:hypothetical protein